RRPLGGSSIGFPLALEAVGPAFVGRDVESGRLRVAWDRVATGSGTFITVVGGGGAGKTRLAPDRAYYGARHGGVGPDSRCDHAHRGAVGLIDLGLRGAGGSIEDLAVDENNVAAALVRYLPAWSGGRPVLIVLDDLHLADAEALEFVADLASWCRSSRL